MLIYHPAYDAYHCLFRLLFVVNQLKEIELQKLRILDFYLVFPKEISSIKLPTEKLYIRKLANQMSNPYHGPINPKQTFRDMAHIQSAVLRSLSATGLVTQDGLTNGTIYRSDKELPSSILSAFENYPIDKEIVKFTLEELSKIPLNGINGLKNRSGLMEYRYDNV